MKKLNRIIKFLAICLCGGFVLYQLYSAGVYGELSARGINPTIKSTPFKFWLVVSVYSLIVATALLLLSLSIDRHISSRFQKYGGSYNLKTVLHVFRDFFSKHK
ncbi:hypothetical protein [Agarivorans aestuarii]|uniref:hypothetical protein n=1 Tax=Agarivorans aestuarii TaxID=1563703 RepID=UPI001C7F5092|nr:hypothetical protein [Agarivorans aestuarii]